jgi:hypothetical protein
VIVDLYIFCLFDIRHPALCFPFKREIVDPVYKDAGKDVRDGAVVPFE